MILSVQLLLLAILGFVPTWAGGQAVRCYNEGHVLRAVACFLISSSITIGYVIIAVLAVKYGFGINTILRAF